MKFETLHEWLNYISFLHPVSIDLGLERVREVAKRLSLLKPGWPVITVAGTNGKGSTVAGLESIYLKAGYRVGAFTTPYLVRHNEQVRIQGQEVADSDFCEAYERIEQERKEISLTIFEFNTLAALYIFKQSNLDICLLEVGLGGRFDAVNIINADIAVITSIGIDHVDRLGDTRELIGREKAGILRANKPVIDGDFFPTAIIKQVAEELNAPIYTQGSEFKYAQEESSWSWSSNQNAYEGLPLAALAIQNMSTVLMAIELMQKKLPVKREAIDMALATVTLPGRIEILSGSVTRVFDVSHNPDAAEFLLKKLETISFSGKIRAVFSMLADKDILSTLKIMKGKVDSWYVAALKTDRAASLSNLLENFRKAEIEEVTSYLTIEEAYVTAMQHSTAGDYIVIFGSFYTVSSVKNKITGGEYKQEM